MKIVYVEFKSDSPNLLHLVEIFHSQILFGLAQFQVSDSY